nr:unnamed protein product [Callosobruchus chinensis]CAH7753608.1 unnamed protein product [Callosobruchus chinensis]CAH7755647.1 unnamed protein product [Callosobruchus chinensis]CAH7763512.1 unnamed protein product [Callosobruchus chinensis]CAH7767667.1 unnamed protein product [Callosobruchus chinensis]
MFVHLCSAYIRAVKCGLGCYQNKQFVTFGSYCR